MGTTITYTDHDGGAPKTSWHGRDFVSEKPVEVDDDADKALIEAAKGNPWFEVKSGGAPAGGNTPYDKGYKAATDGKDKSVPVAYRGKPEGISWETGWDDGAKSIGKVPTDPAPNAGKTPTSVSQASAT